MTIGAGVGSIPSVPTFGGESPPRFALVIIVLFVFVAVVVIIVIVIIVIIVIVIIVVVVAAVVVVFVFVALVVSSVVRFIVAADAVLSSPSFPPATPSSSSPIPAPTPTTPATKTKSTMIARTRRGGRRAGDSPPNVGTPGIDPTPAPMVSYTSP